MKYFLIKQLVITSVLAFAVSTLSADLIVEYDGNTGVSNPGTPGDCITGFDLTRGSGIDQGPGGINAYSSNGFEAADLDEALSMDEYLTFGFSIATNTVVNLTDIVVDVGRTGTAGPSNISLLFDFAGDGFDAGDVISVTAVPNQSGQLTFTGLPTGLTSASGFVEFRFYFDGANSQGGRLDIGQSIGGGSGDVGLQVNGEISKVPEPGTLSLIHI